MSGRCLEGVWKVSRRYLKSARSSWSLAVVLKVQRRCLDGV